MRHPVGEEFTDPGVEIADAEGVAIDGAEALVGGHMNPNAVGTYIITYDYMDTKGAAATTITRQVEVYDNKPPVITLTGEAEIEIFQGLSLLIPLRCYR